MKGYCRDCYYGRNIREAPIELIDYANKRGNMDREILIKDRLVDCSHPSYEYLKKTRRYKEKVSSTSGLEGTEFWADYLWNCPHFSGNTFLKLMEEAIEKKP